MFKLMAAAGKAGAAVTQYRRHGSGGNSHSPDEQGERFQHRGAKAGLSALAAGIIHLGIPKEDAIKYENAITSDKFLVIAHGAPEEVAQARLIVGGAFVP